MTNSAPDANKTESDPYQAPQAAHEPISSGEPPVTGDATSGIIPYKNPAALVAYYLAFVSVIPCFGLVVGAAAFILGIFGLRARRRHPVVKGAVHAWIGIIVGGGAVLFNIAVIAAMFVARTQ